MHKLTTLITITFITFVGTVVQAQDMQTRFPFHVQPQIDGTGVAGWVVLPNTMAKGNYTASLLVLGLVSKHKTNWLEIMGGTHRSQSGYFDPLINIRFQKNPSTRLGISGEIQQTFRVLKRRTLWWFVFDTPTPILKVRIGVEVENVNFWSGKASYGLGPRVSVPIPVKLPLDAKLSLGLTHQFKTGSDFTRLYVITNFKH